MVALHSIEYNSLTAFFYLFAVFRYTSNTSASSDSKHSDSAAATTTTTTSGSGGKKGGSKKDSKSNKSGGKSNSKSNSKSAAAAAGSSEDGGGGDDAPADGEWLSWDEVQAIAVRLKLLSAPVLYRGTFESMNGVQNWMAARAAQKSVYDDTQSGEGFVMRLARGYSSAAFARSVCKYVRAGHVQTKDDWGRTWKKAVLIAPEENEMECALRKADDALKLKLKSTAASPAASAGSAAAADSKSADSKSSAAADSKDSKSKGRTPPRTPPKTPPLAATAAPPSAAAKIEPIATASGSGSGGKSTHTKADTGKPDSKSDSKSSDSKKSGGKSAAATEDSAEEKEKAKERKARTKAAPKLLLCVGLPGSGKSTFGEHMDKAQSGWVWASKDVLGSRDATEKLIAYHLLGGGGKKKGGSSGTGSHVILDMCNITAADRKSWCATAMVDPKDVWCVYFTADAKTCKERVASRSGHATGDLFSWGGAKIIDSHAKKLQIPDVKTEKYLGKVITVAPNLEDLNSALLRFGGIPATPESLAAKQKSAAKPAAADDEDGGGADSTATKDSKSAAAGGEEDDSANAASSATTADDDESVDVKSGSSVAAAVAAAGKSDSKSAPPNYDLCLPTKNMTLTSVCRSLKLDENSVLACYVYGSRLWGTAKADSDWDFVIIKKSGSTKKSGGGKSGSGGSGSSEEKVGNTHIDNIDAAIYEADYFTEKLGEHRILQLLFAMGYLPKQAIWKDFYHSPAAGSGATGPVGGGGAANKSSKKSSAAAASASADGMSGWGFDPAKLYTAMKKDADRDWRIAEKVRRAIASHPQNGEND